MLLIKHTWEYIRMGFPREATFYALPKIHKNTYQPPERPIVSGRGSLTDNLSKFVDRLLQPLVEALPSHIKDTIHLLQILDGLHVDGDTFLVAIDVEALYSSIPHDLGLSVIHVLLHSYRYPDSLVEFTVSSLEFLRKHNYFSFNGSHYLQVQGVAMGTCCASAYANLYLGEWERLLFSDGAACAFARHIVA